MPFLLCALIRETEPFECTVYMNHVGFVFTEIMVGEDKRHLWELWHMDRERECTECTSRTQVGNCLWACSLKDRNARSTCTGRPMSFVCRVSVPLQRQYCTHIMSTHPDIPAPNNTTAGNIKSTCHLQDPKDQTVAQIDSGENRDLSHIASTCAGNSLRVEK